MSLVFFSLDLWINIAYVASEMNIEYPDHVLSCTISLYKAISTDLVKLDTAVYVCLLFIHLLKSCFALQEMVIQEMVTQVISFVTQAISNTVMDNVALQFALPMTCMIFGLWVDTGRTCKLSKK